MYKSCDIFNMHQHMPSIIDITVYLLKLPSKIQLNKKCEFPKSEIIVESIDNVIGTPYILSTSQDISESSKCKCLIMEKSFKKM